MASAGQQQADEGCGLPEREVGDDHVREGPPSPRIASTIDSICDDLSSAGSARHDTLLTLRSTAQIEIRHRPFRGRGIPTLY